MALLRAVAGTAKVKRLLLPVAQQGRETHQGCVFAASDAMPSKDYSTDALADNPMSGPMVPHRVFVAGLPCDIAVYSTLKTDCVAVGDYRGKRIEIRGADALTAADAWTRAATELSRRI